MKHIQAKTVPKNENLLWDKNLDCRIEIKNGLVRFLVTGRTESLITKASPHFCARVCISALVGVIIHPFPEEAIGL